MFHSNSSLFALLLQIQQHICNGTEGLPRLTATDLKLFIFACTLYEQTSKINFHIVDEFFESDLAIHWWCCCSLHLNIGWCSFSPCFEWCVLYAHWALSYCIRCSHIHIYYNFMVYQNGSTRMSKNDVYVICDAHVKLYDVCVMKCMLSSAWVYFFLTLQVKSSFSLGLSIFHNIEIHTI